MSLLLLLDYDGVLHPSSVFMKDGGPVLHGEGKLFMWAGLLEEALTPHPDIKIVLSTSWVRVFGFEEAKVCLPPPLQQRVVGGTFDPHVWFKRWESYSRYQQIRHFLGHAGMQNWLAIDDDGYQWEEADRDRLIQTDPELGISEIVVYERLKKALASLAASPSSTGRTRP